MGGHRVDLGRSRCKRILASWSVEWPWTWPPEVHIPGLQLSASDPPSHTPRDSSVVPQSPRQAVFTCTDPHLASKVLHAASTKDLLQPETLAVASKLFFLCRSAVPCHGSPSRLCC